MSPAGRIALGAAIVIGAGLVGFRAYRFLAAPPEPAVTVAREPLPGPAAASEPAEKPRRPVPDTLPEFRLADRDGVPRSLSHWKDRPLIVNFWATWCAPCRREIPLLQRLRRERAAQGLEVVGIAVDFREDVLRYAKEIGIDYPLLIGEQDGLDAVDAFGAGMALPFSVFSDRRGRIVALKVGELHADEAAFILDRVQEIDAGRLELPAAREAITAGLRALAIRRARTSPPSAESSG